MERDVAVVSLDGLLTGVLERRGGGAGASPSVYIVNTGMSSSVGQDNHWFTVGPSRWSFMQDGKRKMQKERKKTDNPREGWEDGTPPPHRDFKEGRVWC